MTQLMMVWTATVCFLLLALALRTIERFRMATHADEKAHHLIELEKEARLIYCPGDIADEEDSDDL